jgi:hypothetical protein
MVAQAKVEVAILSPSPKYWVYRQAPPPCFALLEWLHKRK